MAVLRLPNPGSDLDRFASTFALIARETQTKSFDLDDMISVMTKHFQASSMGATDKKLSDFQRDMIGLEILFLINQKCTASCTE
jgi:hypothetical protein